MRYSLFLTLSFLATLPSCSNEIEQESNCAITFEDRTYAPFERIDLVTDIVAESLELQTQDETPILIIRDETGIYIRTPIAEPGLVTVEIRKPESCPSLKIRVSEVSESDADLDAILNKLNAISTNLPRAIGATQVPSAEEMGGDLTQADYAAGVIAAYQDGLNKAVAGLTPEERSQLAGMMHKSGLAEIIETLPVNSAPPPNGLWIPTESYDIQTPALLSTQMIFAAHYCTVVRSQGADIASALAATVSASKNVYFAAGATAFSAATFVAFGNAALVCATHPETLSNPSLLSLPELEEDLDLWTASSLTVDAKSGPPANLASLAAGLIFVLNSARTTLESTKKVMTYGFASKGLLESLSQTLIGKAIEKNVGAADFGGWEWKDINIAGDEWVTVIPTGDVFVQKPCPELCLRPLKVGSERVVFVPKIDKFPYSTPELDIIGTVHPITIQFGPPVLPVEPSQFLGLLYDVNWAIDPNLEWHEKTNFDPIGAVFDSTTDEGGIMGYMTPADESAYPVQITATSLSIGGLRAPASSPAPRYDQTLLVLDDLIAGPNGNCVSPGERQELFAFASARGEEIAKIEWSPSTLVQNGVFTAPATPGNYTLTATAKYPSAASISEEVVVNVGDCGCWTSINGSFLNERQVFEMRTVYHSGLDLGIVYILINNRPLVIQFPMFTDDVPEGSFNSGVTIDVSVGGWSSEAVNTRITHEADGVHYQGLVSGVFTNQDNKAGYASISFRGVRRLNKVACTSQLNYDYLVPRIIEDLATMP